MKIGILTNLYPPLIRGGAEWLTYLVAQEFIKQGHNVAVLTLAAPGVSGSGHRVAKIEEGVRVYRFNPGYIYPYLNAAHHALPGRFIWQVQHLVNWPLHSQIARVLSVEGCDLIISANLMGLTFNLPRVLKKLTKTYIHIVHDVQLLHPSGLFIVGDKRGGLMESIYQAITRALFASPHVVIFPSQWLAQEYQSRHFFSGSQIKLLRNPSPQTHLTIKKERSQSLRLLYDGQESEHKGIFWLIKTLQAYPGSDWHLDIVLRGQNVGGDVNKLITTDKRFNVYVNLLQTDIDKQYELADLVIVPSLCMENAPVSITNAFVVGTLVLASRIGGIPELVQDGENGWLFEAGNAKDFHNKLRSVITHPQIINSLGRNFENYQPVTLENYTKEILNLI